MHKVSIDMLSMMSELLHGMRESPNMEHQDIKTNIFTIQSTCMEISISLLCLFVHEPLYKTTVVCRNPVFRHSYLCMDHTTIFTCFPHKCGLARAHPNN